MSRFRLSIAGLLGATALLGVVIAAMTHPAPLWGNGSLSLTLGALVLAILAAVYRSGGRRAFWVGFSTCGWTYFLLLWGPAPISNFGPNLVTIAILDIIYPYTIPTPGGPLASDARDSDDPPSRLARAGGGGKIILAGAFGGGAFPVTPPTSWQIWTTPDRATQFNQGSPLHFRRIGNCLICLLLAAAGGFFTRSLQQSNVNATPDA